MSKVKKTQIVLILGAKGQLAQALLSSSNKPAHFKVIALARHELDITNTRLLAQTLLTIKPSIIINAAGFTQVELAEQAITLASNVNGSAVAKLALFAKQQGVRLIHLSSDYVFDGKKNSPYLCNDTPNPINHYGHSKLEGECGVLNQGDPNSCIVRTSWLYGGQGQHFVTTMLNLMQTKDELNLVADQRGSPTYVVGLAQFIWALCQMKTLSSIYHWSDIGVCSWFEFAVEIQRQALALGLLKQPIHLQPIPSEQYPSNITRPAYSALECQDSQAIYSAVPWEFQLNRYLLSYQHGINHQNHITIL